MFRNFKEIEQYIQTNNIKKKIALCGAHGVDALEAVVQARRKGVAEGILIGDAAKILDLLMEMGEAPEKYEIIDKTSSRDSSELALEMVRDGRADIEMKGLLPSPDFLLPIMHPLDGLIPFGGIFSEATVCHIPELNRFLFVTDCAINITPDMSEKIQIARNVIDLARAFGVEEVKVAAISGTADINPNIPSTVEAKTLADMDWGEGVKVAGPLPLDCVFDEMVAGEKGIKNDVVGQADVLIMPDMNSGNVLHKAMHYLAHLVPAAVICGSTKPVVFTSRSDSTETKYCSILSAILQSIALEKKA